MEVTCTIIMVFSVGQHLELPSVITFFLVISDILIKNL